MVNITDSIYKIVRSHNGIKCADITNIVHSPIDYVSGRLSNMKFRGLIFNDKQAKWHAAISIYSIQHILNEAHEKTNNPFGEWAEGYISALADFGTINENEFDKLIDYIRNK